MQLTTFIALLLVLVVAMAGGGLLGWFVGGRSSARAADEAVRAAETMSARAVTALRAE